LKEGRESAEDNEGSGKRETITPYEENKNTKTQKNFILKQHRQPRSSEQTRPLA
jgi:hypothetical protein